MLSALNIKNFAIIDDLQLEFYNGFNVLTGETGAGKSIIIDALGLLTGDRATPALIKSGASRAYIEGTFLIKDNIKKKIEEILDDELEENVIYVSKDIYLDGRSISKINGKSITLGLLKDVMSLLVDIHSQHDNQYLLNSNNYLSLLDNFMDEEQLKVKNRFNNAYKVYLDIKKRYEEALEENISEEDYICGDLYLVVDEKGKEKTVKKTVNVTSVDGESEYARFFDNGCSNWKKDPEHNLWFLKQQQNWANDKLKAQGYLFLNDVYEMLGVPLTKAGHEVGWLYDNQNSDNYVDFGIFDINRPKNRDFVNGYERTILLDFNVDGVITNKISKW